MSRIAAADVSGHGQGWLRSATGFGHRRIAGFVDVFNVLDANPEQNTNWSCAPSFLRPLSVVPPRLARIGLNLEW